MTSFFNFYSDEDTIVLEISGIYNVLLIIFGIIGVTFNLFESLINIRNKLFIQSLYNCTHLYNNIAGIILSLRHISIGIVNFYIFRNNPDFYDNEKCTIRGMIDMFTIHLFQVSYIFQCLSFATSLIYPIQYMMKLNNGFIKVAILFIIIIWSILPLTMLSIKVYYGFGFFIVICTNFDTWTFPFKIYYLNFTIILIIFLLYIFILTLWNIYGLKSKDEVKKNLNSFMLWTVTIFIIFWAIPNTFMIIFVYLDFKNNIRGILLDIFYLLTAISVTISFPFSIWKNKIVRKHFFEIKLISYLTPRQTFLKISSSF